MELYTIWGFTYEEIMHRWDVWKQFDIVTRVFGTKEKEEQEESTPVNSEATIAALANLFQQFAPPKPSVQETP